MQNKDTLLNKTIIAPLVLEGQNKNLQSQDIDTLSKDLYQIFKNLPHYIKSYGEAQTFDFINKQITEIQNFEKFLDLEQKKRLKQFIQTFWWPIVHKADLCSHCYLKPYGYAGDFLAMEKIWNGRQSASKNRYLGTSEIGKILNAFTLDSNNCKSNESRVFRLKQLIETTMPLNIASIGSGSAIEIYEYLKSRCVSSQSFYLVDQDSKALKFCKSRLSQFNQNINYVEGNILRTIHRLPKSSFDLVYSSGMFDYFNCKSAQKIAQLLWEKVNFGGHLLITNAHPDNPTRFWMEAISEWFLDYKTTDEMTKLTENLKNIHSISLELDKHSVYQYLLIQKGETI